MILQADARHIPLKAGTVQCVVSSPPYWALRDYGVTGQIGLEPSPDEYVATMVGVFREVWRVLKDDGVVWLNLGDSYTASNRGSGGHNPKQDSNKGSWFTGDHRGVCPSGLKPKDLIGIPWRVAFALQADGWYLRSDIIWAKQNPMPESVTDRPTRSHEYVFLLTKNPTYFYDADAIREPSSDKAERVIPDGHVSSWKMGNQTGRILQENGKIYGCPTDGRNKRSVWTINSEGEKAAHFATFPQKLVEPCVLAGTSERGECSACGKNWVRVTESEIIHSQAVHNGTKYGGEGAFGNQAADRHRHGHVPGTKRVTTTGWQPTCTCNAPARPNLVFDPFIGSGTVGRVAERLGRRWVGLELNRDYIAICQRKTAQIGMQFGERR